MSLGKFFEFSAIVATTGATDVVLNVVDIEGDVVVVVGNDVIVVIVVVVDDEEDKCSCRANPVSTVGGSLESFPGAKVGTVAVESFACSCPSGSASTPDVVVALSMKVISSTSLLDSSISIRSYSRPLALRVLSLFRTLVGCIGCIGDFFAVLLAFLLFFDISHLSNY